MATGTWIFIKNSKVSLFRPKIPLVQLNASRLAVIQLGREVFSFASYSLRFVTKSMKEAYVTVSSLHLLWKYKKMPCSGLLINSSAYASTGGVLEKQKWKHSKWDKMLGRIMTKLLLFPGYFILCFRCWMRVAKPQPTFTAEFSEIITTTGCLTS